MKLRSKSVTLKAIEDPAHLLFYFFTRFDKIMNVGTVHNGPDRIGSGLMADQLIIKRSISVSETRRAALCQTVGIMTLPHFNGGNKSFHGGE